MLTPLLVFGAMLFASATSAQSTDITNSTTLDYYYIVYITDGVNYQNTGQVPIGAQSTDNYTPPSGWSVVAVRVVPPCTGLVGTVTPTVTSGTVDDCSGSTNNLQWSSPNPTTVDVEIY